MVQPRSIFPYVASEATVHPGKDEQSLVVWFEVGRGIAHVEMPAELARALADQIDAALPPRPPKTTSR